MIRYQFGTAQLLMSKIKSTAICFIYLAGPFSSFAHGWCYSCTSKRQSIL